MNARDVQFIADGARMQAQGLRMFVGSIRQTGDACATMQNPKCAALAEVYREFARNLERELQTFERQINDI